MVLKKSTMDKTLENTLKASINTMLPTCDDKGVFTNDDDTYRKHKQSTVSGRWQEEEDQGAGCDMGLLSDFSQDRLICEQTFCKRIIMIIIKDDM